MAEWPLESSTATDPHATAFTGGDGRPIGQRRGRVAAVPADVESTGLRPVLEAAHEKSPLDIACVEPVAIDRPASCRIRHPRHQARAVRPLGESPPETYGVPDTEFTRVSSVTVANMRPDTTRVFYSGPKSVKPFTTRTMYWLLHVVAAHGQTMQSGTPALIFTNICW